MDGLPARTTADAEMLLSLWESGLAHRPSARAQAMLQRLDARSEADSTLGIHNRRLIDLHARLFGDELDLTSHCPGCNATVEFGARCSALTVDVTAEAGAETERLEVDGYEVEFRLPGRSDVAIAAAGCDDDAFARRLFDRCMVSASYGRSSVASADLPDAAIDAVSCRMESLDPAALLSFLLECPECSLRWNAPLDIDHLLWTKVQAAAERLLLDVDALARVYGWTERDVLELNPTRRAAYLQLAGA